MVHLTETCDPGLPRVVVHTDTTPADVQEVARTGAIHEVLSKAGLTPSKHLVDAAYVSAEQLVVAAAQQGIDLIGPTQANHHWQRRDAEAIREADFTVDWERCRAR